MKTIYLLFIYLIKIFSEFFREELNNARQLAVIEGDNMFGRNQKNDDQRFDREFFTIYDSKTGIYREPMIAFNQHDILRQLNNMMQDPAQSKNPLVTNAEDYSLFQVGAYDQKSGEIRPTTPLVHIANLHDIRAAIQRRTPAPTQAMEAQAYS